MTLLYNEYYDWLLNKIDIVNNKNYILLMNSLMNTEFRWKLPMDENRAEAGKALRSRFFEEFENGYYSNVNDEEFLSKPCSLLEMMIAMAISCEEDIMYSPNIEDRTQKWFWIMIENLGLMSMTDDNWDSNYILNVTDTLMDRKFSYHGEGSLFTVRKPLKSMKKTPFWYQLHWYIDELYN